MGQPAPVFWLSLIPFTTAWMGENRFATAPVALYGAVLLGAAIACSLYLLVARVWLVPDPRIERKLVE